LPVISSRGSLPHLFSKQEVDQKPTKAGGRRFYLH
jgi:hypothetical protein